ncbi:TPA: integrating conjugative element protein, partial [Haemophilus influenzae]
VTKDTVVSRADAERDLARRTQEFANRARNNVSSSTWDKLPPNAQAALTSYAYNYGSLTKDVIAAAQASAQSGDMNALANAVRNRQNNNNGVNAKRRNQEADYILGK